jgi:hypothetical protein
MTRKDFAMNDIRLDTGENLIEKAISDDQGEAQAR